MDSNQIRRVMRGRTNCFIGVFPADKLATIPHRLRQLKKYKIQPAAFILNTDESWLPGQHWLAFYVPASVHKNESINVFDSFGGDSRLHQSFVHTKYFKQFIRAMRQSHGRQSQPLPSYRINRQRLQSINTAICGYYSILFILLRCQGMGFNEIIRNLVKCGSTHASRDNQITRIFKKLLWPNTDRRMPHEQQPNLNGGRIIRPQSHLQCCTSMINCV